MPGFIDRTDAVDPEVVDVETRRWVAVDFDHRALDRHSLSPPECDSSATVAQLTRGLRRRTSRPATRRPAGIRAVLADVAVARVPSHRCLDGRWASPNDTDRWSRWPRCPSARGPRQTRGSRRARRSGAPRAQAGRSTAAGTSWSLVYCGSLRVGSTPMVVPSGSLGRLPPAVPLRGVGPPTEDAIHPRSGPIEHRRRDVRVDVVGDEPRVRLNPGARSMSGTDVIGLPGWAYQGGEG